MIPSSLKTQGWAWTPNWLSPEETRALAEDLLQHGQELKPARMGKGTLHRADQSTRGDGIAWWEPADLRPAQKVLWSRLEALRARLNEELWLGLWETEAHYARYEPGQRYARHLDRFQNDSARTVSCVIYLNTEWDPQWGGELVLHLPEGPRTIAPLGGGLVTFLSAEVPHEVLAPTRPRLSVAAWMKTRAST